ncbi:MAG: glycosyltransferase [Solirubrobacterales bacterium]
MITSVWPYERNPAYGPYVRDIVDEVRRQGVPADVLFIRGYRSAGAYLAGALVALLMPIAYPRRYRLVHCHTGEAALAARFFFGAPVLASYLGTDILGAQIGGGLKLRATYGLRSRIIRAHAGLMSATTTKSREMEALLTPRARARNAVIPDGVDRARFHPRDRELARAELGWRTDRTIVLFAGRVESPEKRLWLAREVVGLAGAEIPGLELRIVSDVPPEAMPVHYAAADCLLHTSVSEGSSNVIKEALACDLPVLATPAGDVRELLDGVAGCMVCEPRAPALASALVELLSRYRESDGRDHTGGLSIEEAARRTIAEYRALGVPCS